MADLPNRGDYERQLTSALAYPGQLHADELATALKNDPLADPGAAYWEKVERDRRSALAAILLLVFMDSATSHGMSTTRASIAAEPWAAAQATIIASNSTQYLRDRLAKSQAEWRVRAATTTEPSIPVLTPQEIDELADKLFNEASVERMSVTQTTNAISDASEIAMGEAGLLSDDDEWVNMPNLSKSGPCPTCEDLGGTLRPYWSRKFPMGTPAHDGCVCYIKYANVRA